MVPGNSLILYFQRQNTIFLETFQSISSSLFLKLIRQHTSSWVLVNNVLEHSKSFWFPWRNSIKVGRCPRQHDCPGSWDNGTLRGPHIMGWPSIYPTGKQRSRESKPMFSFLFCYGGHHLRTFPKFYHQIMNYTMCFKTNNPMFEVCF